MAARVPLLLALTVVLLVSPLASAKDAKADAKPEVKLATAKELKHELKVFKKDFDTVDIDFQLDAVQRISKCIHKDVTKLLLKLLRKEKDVYIRVEVAKGLALQTPFKDTIGKKFMPMLEDKDIDPMLLSTLIRTLGKLDFRRAWPMIVELIGHVNDDVVVACFTVLGDWDELRAIQKIQEFWNRYPTKATWTTGSTSVDTGAAGDADQRAAKQKWNAKFGGSDRNRARPEPVKALKAALTKMTGEKLKTPSELREWCAGNKRKLAAAERRRP